MRISGFKIQILFLSFHTINNQVGKSKYRNGHNNVSGLQKYFNSKNLLKMTIFCTYYMHAHIECI